MRNKNQPAIEVDRRGITGSASRIGSTSRVLTNGNGRDDRSARSMCMTTVRPSGPWPKGPRRRNDGLIVVVSSIATIQRDLLIKLAARHRLPAVYPNRFFVDAGGLMSYGPNLLDGYRRSASYVDRILRGEKPADLPVQAPTGMTW